MSGGPDPEFRWLERGEGDGRPAVLVVADVEAVGQRARVLVIVKDGRFRLLPE